MQTETLLFSFFIFLFPIIFVLFWAGIVYMISHLSGWQKLAGKYATRMEPPIHGPKMASMRLGLSRYNGVVRMGFNPNGMYLSVFILFRPGHTPLFIPWSAFCEVQEVTVFFRKMYRIQLGTPHLTTMIIPTHYFKNWEAYLFKNQTEF